MGRASKYVVRSVIRLMWARSVRGLMVLLLGGVLITMLVRAVEGQGARDPVSRPASPQVASDDSSGARSLDGAQVAMVLNCDGAGVRSDRTASSLSPVMRGTAMYAELDAAILHSRPNWFPLPDSGDHCERAESLRSFHQTPRTWELVPLPKDIRQAVGNGEVYFMAGGGEQRMLVGVRDRALYDLPHELNDFLVDGGFILSPQHVADVVRVYTFFMLAYERVALGPSKGVNELTGPPQARLDSIERALIPIVPVYDTRILSVDMSVTSLTGRPQRFVRGVRAQLSHDGRQDTMSVEFDLSGWYPGKSFPARWHTGIRRTPPELLKRFPAERRRFVPGPVRIEIRTPSCPRERRSEVEKVEFEVCENSCVWKESGYELFKPRYCDTAAYAVVHERWTYTSATPWKCSST
jgi:hypothetical protein